jgi:hypothetical protein
MHAGSSTTKDALLSAVSNSSGGKWVNLARADDTDEAMEAPSIGRLEEGSSSSFLLQQGSSSADGRNTSARSASSHMRLGMLENGTFTWDAMSIHDDDNGGGDSFAKQPNRTSVDNHIGNNLLANSLSTGDSKSYATGATTKTKQAAAANEKAPRRTRAEANLHHVLHRLVAIVNDELKALVPSFAKSILHAPAANNTERAEFYSQEVFKEHKSYFKKLMIKKENSVHNHLFKGNYRVPDKLQYCFDRSFHKTFDASGMYVVVFFFACL